MGVNLIRDGNGVVQLRIVWPGGLVSERSIGVPTRTFRDTDRERRLLGRIRALADAGLDDVAIAEHLNRERYRPCRGTAFSPSIVRRLRCRHENLKRLERLRRGERPPGYTVREVARLIKVDRSWISRKISLGQILLEKDTRYGCYLFPRTRSTIDQLKQLKNRKVLHV